MFISLNFSVKNICIVYILCKVLSIYYITRCCETEYGIFLDTYCYISENIKEHNVFIKALILSKYRLVLVYLKFILCKE